VSDHFDGRRFFNPDEPTIDRSFVELLRWRWGGTRARWPVAVPVTPATPDMRVDDLRATVVGHASVLVQSAGLNILTDPVWSERASPVTFLGPKRVTAPGIAFDDLPPIDVVLLSHNHYDHLDAATLRRLQARDAPLIVSPIGNDELLRRIMPGARIVVADWGDRVAIPNGDVYVVPANHWSARTGRDRREALWGGFMLRTSAGLVYFAGDTGYGTGRIFPAMRASYGAPDLALIPIGAYHPRWFLAAQHCDPDEAVRIMLAFEARTAIGIHWGTFQLTDEPYEDPARLLSAALASRGINPGRFLAGRPGMVLDA
jgi:L-ascorbate metabolism protein UlaG (beta-lactamase superfamily)